jgi:CRP-like cAMP-binding protein
MADFLDEKRDEIAARIRELKPLVDEYTRLEAAAVALGGVTGNGASAAPPKAPRAARSTKPAPARSRSTKTKRRGRPKGSGARGTQALELVKASPGITIPELAEKMGIKQNYLYRVLPGLAEDGLVKKDGRGWHVKDAA